MDAGSTVGANGKGAGGTNGTGSEGSCTLFNSTSEGSRYLLCPRPPG
jgi:hypothetical protein